MMNTIRRPDMDKTTASKSLKNRPTTLKLEYPKKSSSQTLFPPMKWHTKKPNSCSRNCNLCLSCTIFMTAASKSNKSTKSSTHSGVRVAAGQEPRAPTRSAAYRFAAEPTRRLPLRLKFVAASRPSGPAGF